MIKYEYTLKRSARRSISVSIKDDNTLVVHAPVRMTVSEIERFLTSKSNWIDAHLQRNAAKNGELSDIISYKKILFAGTAVDLTVGAVDVISSDGVQVKSLKNLKSLYVDSLGGRFLRLFEEIAGKNNLSYGKVGFKDYKAKWGCCDGERNVTFNYKILMLPENLWRYVIVHELCHTVYMDHSNRFYALVERILPCYKTDRKQLKNYSRITRLY